MSFLKKHALRPSHTVSQIHECTVAHIAMLLLAKSRPHNVSHSSSLLSHTQGCDSKGINQVMANSEVGKLVCERIVI